MRWTVIVVQLLASTMALSYAAPMVKRETDDSLHKFEEIKTRLEELKEVLKDLGQELEKADVEYTKRNKLTKPNEELDDDIQEIVDKISPEDLKLLKEYNNKAHYFLNAVKENPNGLEPDPPQESPKSKSVPPKRPETKPVDPDADSAPRPEQHQTEPNKRNQDGELEDYINHLSEEDQKMLKGMESKLHYLKTALHTSGGNENDKNTEGESAKRQELNGGFSKDLQPEDIELLQKLKERLKYLKNALKEQKENAILEEESKKPQEGEFGEFVKREEINTGHWKGKALLDSQLGAQQSEEQKRCGVGDKRCEDEDDHEEDFVAEAEQRFMKDVDFAREHGVKITELLRALKARKVEQLRREEKELEQLSLHGQ